MIPNTTLSPTAYRLVVPSEVSSDVRGAMLQASFSAFALCPTQGWVTVESGERMLLDVGGSFARILLDYPVDTRAWITGIQVEATTVLTGAELLPLVAQLIERSFPAVIVPDKFGGEIQLAKGDGLFVGWSSGRFWVRLEKDALRRLRDGLAHEPWDIWCEAVYALGVAWLTDLLGDFAFVASLVQGKPQPPIVPAVVAETAKVTVAVTPL